jgi:hypothetical protein
MVRDAALRGAFLCLFAGWGGFVRVLTVTRIMSGKLDVVELPLGLYSCESTELWSFT